MQIKLFLQTIQISNKKNRNKEKEVQKAKKKAKNIYQFDSQNQK